MPYLFLGGFINNEILQRHSSCQISCRHYGFCCALFSIPLTMAPPAQSIGCLLCLLSFSKLQKKIYMIECRILQATLFQLGCIFRRPNFGYCLLVCLIYCRRHISVQNVLFMSNPCCTLASTRSDHCMG